MTGTPFCILPVTSLNSVIIGKGKIGKVTRLLLDTWSKNVGIDIEYQIKGWDSQRCEQLAAGPTPYSFK